MQERCGADTVAWQRMQPTAENSFSNRNGAWQRGNFLQR